MDITKLKLPIGLVIAILLQASGLIWYISGLDSSVRHLDTTVAKLKDQVENESYKTQIAVLEAQLNHLKEQPSPTDYSKDINDIRGSALDQRLTTVENLDLLNERITSLSQSLETTQDKLKLYATLDDIPKQTKTIFDDSEIQRELKSLNETINNLPGRYDDFDIQLKIWEIENKLLYMEPDVVESVLVNIEDLWKAYSLIRESQIK